MNLYSMARYRGFENYEVKGAHRESYELSNLTLTTPYSTPSCNLSLTRNSLPTLLKSCICVIDNVCCCAVVTDLRRNSLLPKVCPSLAGPSGGTLPKTLTARGLPYLYLSRIVVGAANCAGQVSGGDGTEMSVHMP